MNPLERAARALHKDYVESRRRMGVAPCDLPAWDDLGSDGKFSFYAPARAVLEAIREPIAEASIYLKADAEAWELGAKGAPHEVYLMECGRLRRAVAEKIDTLLANREDWERG